MRNWGQITHNKQRGTYAVRGMWQGKRWYFSHYNSDLGPRTCASFEEAKHLQMVISSEIANGIFNPERYSKQKPLHVKTYIKHWLKQVEPNISYSTLKAYRAAARYIECGLGDVFLPDLNYERIRKWVNGLKLNIKTKKNYHGVLVCMLRDAKRSGHIPQMPDVVRFSGGLSIPQKKPDWIDAKTQGAILQEIPRPHRPIFQFLFATGVRVSEARALRRCDVFRDRGYIVIRQTFAPTRHGGESLVVVKQKQERTIPFYDALQVFWDSIPIHLNSEFVFINPDTGRPYTKNINRDIWNPACKRCLGYVVPLNVAGRHSFGTQLAMRGVGMESIRDLLGHSDTGVTRRHYANPSLDAMKKIVEKR